MNKHWIQHSIRSIGTLQSTTTTNPKFIIPNGRPGKPKHQVNLPKDYQKDDTPQMKLRYANNPTELIIRIQKLSRKEGIKNPVDLAIELVKSSSVRVASISVWTELFKLILKHRKFSLTYKLFLDIKRRNIQLDLKFFHFYFHLISQSPKSNKNYSLERLESIWSQAQATIKKDPFNQSILISLTNAYLTCLCSHDFKERAFHLFNSLPPTSIDASTLHQLSKSLTPTPEDLQRARDLIKRFPTSTSSSSSLSSLTTRNPLGNPIEIDLRTTLHLASLFFKSTRQPTDQQFGAKILEDRLGIQIETNQYQFWNKSKPPLSIINNNNNDTNSHEEEEKYPMRFNPGQFTTLLRMLLKIKKYALIRRLWYQIIANRDLYLQRNALDQTHCGLVMIAMGKCKAMPEVESLLAWMIKSGDKRLRPTMDTLDKAVQAAWETEDLTAGTLILASLTQTYEGLVRPETTDSDHELVKLSKESTKLKPIKQVSNRALCTILQTAGRIGTISEINRALIIVEKFNRRLPEKKTPTQIQLEHQEKEKGLFLSENPNQDQVHHLNDSNQNFKNLIEFEKYWFDQFIWVLTDLLDKILSRKDSWKVIEKSKESHQIRNKSKNKISRLDHLKQWRQEIDKFLASDLIQFRQLRSRIEVRASDRLLNKQLVSERKKFIS